MKVLNLGLCSYQQAYQKQIELVEKVINNPQEQTIICCSHNPVVTLGKKTQTNDLQGWKGEIHRIERGGRATYHGPGQVILYPIIHLKNYSQNLSGYLEALEKSMIDILKNYQVKATGNPNRGEPLLTGVWVDNKKIASIGIAVKRWVTYHGLAFNLHEDPLAFQGISPCGFSTSQMTSLERVLGKRIERSSFEKEFQEILIHNLQSL